MKRLVLAVLIAVAVTPSAVQARSVDVRARLAPVVEDARASGVVVLFPSRANLDYAKSKPIFAQGSGSKSKGEWSLSLSAARDCDGAGACFLAGFTGDRGAKLGYRTTNVSLALGMKGHYQASRCGASCSPASIAWIQKGVRYEIQAKALGGRKAFISMADSAINNGNRR